MPGAQWVTVAFDGLTGGDALDGAGLELLGLDDVEPSGFDRGQLAPGHVFAGERVRQSLANGLDRLGFGGVLAVFTLLLAGGLATGLVRRSRFIPTQSAGSASRPPTTATRSGPTTSGTAKMSGK